MDRRLLAAALIVVGVALAVVSGLGDAIGIGAEEDTFGWKQVAGLVVGVALVAVGVGTLIATRREPADRG
jgi:predicted MFS family arabinose efflux permease